MVKYTLLFLIFWTAVVSSGTFPSDHKYTNTEYGYSVLIPENLTIIINPPPQPRHGFRLNLSINPEAYIWVDGSYNTLEWANLQEAIDTHIGWLKQEGASLFGVSQQEVFLGQLQGLRSIIHYKQSSGDDIMVQDLILALGQRNNHIEIVYTCGLRTSQSRYERDKNVFEDIIATWRLKPLPTGLKN